MLSKTIPVTSASSRLKNMLGSVMCETFSKYILYTMIGIQNHHVTMRSKHRQEKKQTVLHMKSMVSEENAWKCLPMSLHPTPKMLVLKFVGVDHLKGANYSRYENHQIYPNLRSPVKSIKSSQVVPRKNQEIPNMKKLHRVNSKKKNDSTFGLNPPPIFVQWAPHGDRLVDGNACKATPFIWCHCQVHWMASQTVCMVQSELTL